MSERRDELPLPELSDELDPRERAELAARIALAAGEVEPSPELRDRVLARIEAREAARRVGSSRRWQAAAALLAAALAGGVLTWAALLTDRAPEPAPLADRGEAADELPELEALLEEQDEEIAALEAQLGAVRDAMSVLLAERLERLDLAAAEGDASARVYWDWEEYSCFFVAEGLPAAGSGRRYVLWLHTDAGELLRAGGFEGGRGDGSRFFAMLPKEMGKVVRAVVTAEAGEPGDAPQGPVVLSGRTEI